MVFRTLDLKVRQYPMKLTVEAVPLFASSQEPCARVMEGPALLLVNLRIA